MSSNRARDIHGARKDGYKDVEGKVVKLESKGPVKNTVEHPKAGPTHSGKRNRDGQTFWSTAPTNRISFSDEKPCYSSLKPKKMEFICIPYSTFL